MSQVCTSLGLEVKGQGDTRYHHLASLPRLLQPGSATSAQISWSERHLGSGESVAGSQDRNEFPLAYGKLAAPYSRSLCTCFLDLRFFPAASSPPSRIRPIFLGWVGSLGACSRDLGPMGAS